MGLQEKIKSDLIVSMKEKNEDVKSLLRVVLGEIDRIGKEVSDDNIIKILKKMKENSDELGNLIESNILELYLPTMLSDNELETVIKKYINENEFNGMKDMGKIMKLLRNDFGSTYDGKIASQMVKNNLQ